MFSNFPILDDFVYSIPLCQLETDLSSILSIFQRLNCQQLAVFMGDSRWGTINSVDLLSLITEVYFNEKIVVCDRPGSRLHRSNISTSNKSITSIIKPAVVYRADTKLDDFLSGVPEGSLSEDSQEYLLVNRQGKLQGKLHKNKVLEYLASKVEQNPHNYSQLPTGSNYWLDLLDSIPLPLKIETASGKDFYVNTCWQELMVDQRQKQHRQSRPNKAIASWWMEQQQAKKSPTSQSDRAKAKLEDEAKNDYLTALSSRIVSPASESHSDIATNFVSENPWDRASNSARPKLQIEQIDDWNWIKIPLTASNKLSENSVEYWLVLATKVPEQSLAKTTESPILKTTAKVLEVVSHELKSPLTGIVGLANLLEAQKLGQLNKRQARYVSLIHSSGQKMMNVVNDLVKLTSLADELSSSEPESIDLELLCRQIYQQLLDRDRPPADSERLELSLDSESQIAIANKACLSQILFHLMMETVEITKSPEQLKIKINSLAESTAITIGSMATDISTADSGWHLAIAKYLAAIVRGNLTSEYTSTGCQLTLLLPRIKSSYLSSPSSTATAKKIDKPNLTILCLYPEAKAISAKADDRNGSNFDLRTWSDRSQQQTNYRHRIIEADGLEQAHTLARIWQLDVIVLAGDRIEEPLEYLRSLQTSKYLSAIPLITLDNRTTEAANQIKGLNVYPCLLPAEHRSVSDLMEVIQIAAGVNTTLDE